MDSQRWRRVEELFSAAVEMAESERDSYLREQCGSDAVLLEEVRSMILGDARAAEGRENLARQVGSLLGRSGSEDSQAPLADRMIGQRLGPFRLTEIIGKGGMGTVYRAERADGQFRQQVAVKLVNRGMNNEFITDRFLQERQILAGLNHAYIARLVDGGTTQDGTPYFVMEHVDGEPLYRFCAQRGLSVDQRLRLFVRVCEAVGYAHGRRVVHRDIKPSNILVTDEGLPRLLDFGIAKIIDPESANTSMFLGTHMPLMTPEYASPEQLAGFGAGVRSDIYSLGVMLFELMTGRRPRPADSGEWDGAIPSPSLAVAAGKLPACGIPPAGLDPAGLRAALEAGLDGIVARCTARKPSDRYQSVAELIEAITLYLESRSAAATGPRPDPRSSFRRRYWVMAGAAVVLAAAGVVIQARRAGTSAELIRVLTFANLNGDEVTARFARTLGEELVTELTRSGWTVTKEESAATLDGSIRSEGGVHRVSARMTGTDKQTVTWARAFEGKRESDIARMLAAALGTSRPQATVSAEASATLVEGYTHLRWEGPPEEPAQARARIGRAIETFEKATRASPGFARAWAGLAMAESLMADHWDHPKYEEWMRRTESSARKAIELDPSLDTAHERLGVALFFGRHDFKAALDAFARTVEFNPRTATPLRLLADLLCLFDRYDEAIAELVRAQSLDPREPDLVAHEALVRFWRRQYGEAEKVARRAIAMNPEYWYGHWVLGMVLQQRNQFVEAEKELRESVRIQSPGTRTITALGHFLGSTGRRGDAEEIIGRIRKGARGSLRGYVYPEALIRAGLGDREQALSLLEKSYEIGDLSLPYTKLDPRMEPIRRDPRFRALLAKLGLPD